MLLISSVLTILSTKRMENRFPIRFKRKNNSLRLLHSSLGYKFVIPSTPVYSQSLHPSILLRITIAEPYLDTKMGNTCVLLMGWWGYL